MSLTIEVVGQGYIYSATRWESTARLSAGGTFGFALPATDAGAALIGALRTVRCRWRGAVVAAGLISGWSIVDGMLEVRGEDMARELATRTLTATIESGGGAMSLYNAVAWLITQLPAGWTGVNGVAPGNPATVYLQAVNDSILAVLGTICELGGCWFAISGTTLTVDDSLGAVRYNVPLLDLSTSVDASDIVNRIVLHGAGDGEAALDLGPATASAPGGYALNLADSSLVWSSSPYPLRERAVALPWIGPLAATDAGVAAAANALLLGGVQWLQRYATPVESYQATVAYQGVIAPLERVALNWRGRGLAVNATPAVVESRLSIEPGEMLTTGLVLEADARRLPTDAEVLAQALQEANRARLWPQLTVANETMEGAGLITHAPVELAAVMAWPASIVQVRGVTLEIEATLADETQQLPATVEWRLNGAGSWATYTGPVDISAGIVGATSRRPAASSFTVNVRGTAPAQKIFATGATLSGTYYPAGNDLVLLNRPWRLFSATGNEAAVVAGTNMIAELPAGTVVRTATGTNPYSVSSYNGAGHTGLFLRVFWGEQEGYILLYQHNASNVVQAYQPGNMTGQCLTTAYYSAQARARVSVRASRLG